MKIGQKEIAEFGLTGVLIIVLLFALGNVVKKSQGHNIKAIKAQTLNSVTAPVAQSNIDSENLYNALEEQVKSAELKRDPFTGASITLDNKPHAELSLTGILWDKTDPLAIINGNVVKKGDPIGNKTVVEINQDSVVLSDGNTLLEFKLGH